MAGLLQSHGSLNGKTPWEKWWDLAGKTPFTDEVIAMFDDSKEHLRLQNYKEGGCQKFCVNECNSAKLIRSGNIMAN